MDTSEAPQPVLDDRSGISTSDSCRNFVRNSASNLVLAVFSAATSLYMVPFLIANLGVANYGMVTLANSFVLYTEVFTAAIFGTVFRFASVHIARGEYDEAQGYFNTQLVFIAWFVRALIPLAAAVSVLAPRMINIPSGQTANTQLLLFLIYVSFALSVISSPFRLGTFVKQRFDISNLIEIGNQVLRYSTWILLFALAAPKTWHVGIGYILGSLGFAFAHYIAFRIFVPQLKLRLGSFDKTKFLQMARTGIWMTLGQVGAVLYLSADLLIINRTLGPESVGLYSPVLGLSMMLRGVSGMMTGLMLPVSVSCYAQRDWGKLIRGACSASKLMSLGMAIPAGIICGLSRPFLTTWLGPEFGPLYPLVWLMLVHQVFNAGVEPLFGVNLAANKVAVPGVATVVGGVLKVVLSVILAVFTPLGLYGVAIGTLISFVLKNLMFIPYYEGIVLKTSSRPFYMALVPSFVLFAASAGLSALATRIVNLDTLLHVFAAGAITGLVCALLGYMILCDREEKQLMRRMMPWLRANPE